MKTSVKSVLSLAASGVALLLVSQSASATCTPESYTGSICYTAATFCPQDYLDADGRELKVRDYQVLFSLLGNLYGGDGTTTFNLPNLQERLPMGMSKTLKQGTMRGNDSVTLTQSNLPASSVNASVNKGVSDVPSATNNQLSAATGPNAKIYGPKGGTQVALAGSVDTPAAGQQVEAVNIVPTQTVLRACIVANGIYPPRP